MAKSVATDRVCGVRFFPTATYDPESARRPPSSTPAAGGAMSRMASWSRRSLAYSGGAVDAPTSVFNRRSVGTQRPTRSSSSTGCRRTMEADHYVVKSRIGAWKTSGDGHRRRAAPAAPRRGPHNGTRDVDRLARRVFRVQSLFELTVGRVSLVPCEPPSSRLARKGSAVPLTRRAHTAV